MTTSKFAGRALALCAMAGLSGCGAFNKANVGCLSPDGQDVVIQIVKDEVEKLAGQNVKGDDGRPMVSIGSLRASVAKIAFTIVDVRTSKEDPDSTKKFCAGNLKAVVPVDMLANADATYEATQSGDVNALVERYGAERNANTLTIPIDFTVQPTDDRKNVYGEIETPDAIRSLFSDIVLGDALRSRVEQARADQAQAEAEQIRLETEARNAEQAAAMTEAKSRFDLAVQGINGMWQAIPEDVRDQLTPQQTAFNRRKRAACALQASQTSTEPNAREVARLDCEAQMMNTRANELSRYVSYDSY